MMHDPKAFAHLSRRMRAPVPAPEPLPPTIISDLIRRVDAMLAERERRSH